MRGFSSQSAVAAQLTNRRLRGGYLRRDLYDTGEVMRRAKIKSVTELQAAMANRGLPAPILGQTPGTPLWLRDAVEAWIRREQLRSIGAL
jgi:hypothetical protein